MLKVAYIKNNSEREQRIEALARQVVRNHIKRMQKKSSNGKALLPTVADSLVHHPTERGDQD